MEVICGHIERSGGSFVTQVYPEHVGLERLTPASIENPPLVSKLFNLIPVCVACLNGIRPDDCPYKNPNQPPPDTDVSELETDIGVMNQ
jgi:hypothetical protein